MGIVIDMSNAIIPFNIEEGFYAAGNKAICFLRPMLRGFESWQY